MTTQSKAKRYVLLSGTHSRVEGDRRVKYFRGDLIEPTAAELAAFPDKFLPIEEFEARLGAFKNQKAKDAQFRKAAARNAKKAARSPEAKRRGDQLLEMRKSAEKRLTV
jgi:hypothetical protein